MAISKARFLAALLFVLPAWLLAADEVVTPRALKPDAELPAIDLTVDLGQQSYSHADEEKRGKEVVGFYASQIRPLPDAVQQARVETIGHKVITAAVLLGPRQIRLDPGGEDGLAFTFRILDTEDINAFSVWGGNIYLTRGMIEFCQSDDELAGVMAHEVAHNLYHHLRHMVKRLQEYQQQQILAMIAAGFMGIDVAKAAVMLQYVHLALLNGYGIENERQADFAGCFYTYRAGYNPVGMITVFERLHRLTMRRPNPVELGAFQTHPWSDERAAALEDQVRALGLPINRRAVTNAMTAGVRVNSGPAEGGGERIELLLGDTPLMEVASKGDRPTAEDRAADLALAINRALHRGLRSSELRLDRTSYGYRLWALNRLQAVDLVDIREDDAATSGQSPEEFAQSVFRRFQARCRQEEYNRGAL